MTAGNFALIGFAAIGNLVLGGLILFSEPKGRIHRSFAAFSVAVAAWTLSNGLVSAYADTQWGYIWGRLAFVSAAVIPVAFLLFACEFPTPRPAPPRSSIFAFATVGGLAFLVSFTPLILKSTRSVAGNLHVDYGPLHLPFGVYFVLCFGFSLFLLTRKLLVLTGLQKLQVRYLFAGVLVAAIGATVANLVIPLVLGSSQFSRYGPLFGMLMLAVVAHAIIRHRLMDIKVVVRKGVVYVCAILAAAAAFIMAAELLKRIGAYQRDNISTFEALLVAILLAILFQPLKTLINTSLNRYLYRQNYDFHRIVRDASRRLSTILDLDPLLDYLVYVIEDTFKTEMVAVYLKADSDSSFDRVLPRTTQQAPYLQPEHIAGNAALPRYLRTARTAVVREEAVRHASDASLSRVSAMVAELGGDIVFPLLENQMLIGFIVIGPKRSGDPFFVDDISLLETLISQASITITNAKLYRQVVLVNEYVDNILSTMDSGVIAVNAAGNISLFNSAAERLTGLAALDQQGSPYHLLPLALASPLRDTIEHETPRLQFETIIPNADGTSIPVVCSTATLRYGHESMHGALLVFSDLSRLKELEQEKRRAERLASFGALASGVAHEIKNPLVAIRTFAELLPERFTDVDFRDDFSKVVIREIARIDDLVGRLRGLAAATPEHTGTIDVRVPIKDTLTLLRAQFEQTRTAVSCEFPECGSVVAVPEAQLKQLFLNLFLNALEAMGRDGTLRIRVTAKDQSGGRSIAVEVSDTGPGIPDALRGHVFDPFFTTKPKGSGLGLAICRGITDAHRGTISAYVGPDKRGTTICVELPAINDPSIITDPNVVHS